ncbi:MAG TPA: hypothetical protein PLE24_14725 [Chitinispirillaceae bacterium]|nr:hypothetical protein [Chitinispirillaceae bacterium]
MGITDQIKASLESKLVIRYKPDREKASQSLSCVICGNGFKPQGTLCLYAKNEGYVCEACGRRFVPEMMEKIDEYQNRDIRKIIRKDSPRPLLSSDEWKDVNDNLEALSRIMTDFAKAVSRGIVESSAGCIGVLHYARDIPAPPRNPGESDLDYESRSKSIRQKKLFEKIRKETCGRIELLHSYFAKLGMPVTGRKVSDNGIS